MHLAHILTQSQRKRAWCNAVRPSPPFPPPSSPMVAKCRSSQAQAFDMQKVKAGPKHTIAYGCACVCSKGPLGWVCDLKQDKFLTGSALTGQACTRTHGGLGASCLSPASTDPCTERVRFVPALLSWTPMPCAHTHVRAPTHTPTHLHTHQPTPTHPPTCTHPSAHPPTFTHPPTRTHLHAPTYMHPPTYTSPPPLHTYTHTRAHKWKERA